MIHFIICTIRYTPSSKREIEITDLYTEQLNFELARELVENVSHKIITRLICD